MSPPSIWLISNQAIRSCTYISKQMWQVKGLRKSRALCLQLTKHHAQSLLENFKAEQGTELGLLTRKPAAPCFPFNQSLRQSTKRMCESQQLILCFHLQNWSWKPAILSWRLHSSQFSHWSFLAPSDVAKTAPVCLSWDVSGRAKTFAQREAFCGIWD